jgi:hypothetical protein
VSALTKIFVVLHVIVSLLLASALIVFVNRQENFKETAKLAKEKQLLAESRVNLIVQDVAKVTAQKDALATELNNQINTLKTAIDTSTGTIAQLQGQLAEKDAAITQLTAANTSATAALAVAQQDIKARQEAFNTLFVEKDKIQKELVEEGNKITELQNTKDVLTRTTSYNQEQVSGLETENNRLREVLRKYNISPTGNQLPAGGAINSTPSVNINGIVRDFKNINGVPFATISLGSADQVTHGMKFNVIDPTKNQFLGYLTVDTVGVHEATGRLDGPAVDKVRPNVSEVRTQL